MAPVLQCPDCRTKHPIADVPSQGAFPCRGCGRVLKVPEAVAQRAAPAPVPGPAAAPPPPPPDQVATRVVPIVEENPRPAPAPEAPAPPAPLTGRRLGGPKLGSVPWWMRLLLWVVAIPVGFLMVFGLARAFGIFTGSDLSNLFLANGTSRFWPVVRLLPFVALLIAVLVQGGVYMLARMRGGKSRTPAKV